MENTGLMSQGLTLLTLGMGTVFVFLALLVIVTSTMSRLVSKYLPAPAIASPNRRPAVDSTSPVSDPRLLAVITAAIHRHRSQRRD